MVEVQAHYFNVSAMAFEVELKQGAAKAERMSRREKDEAACEHRKPRIRPLTAAGQKREQRGSRKGKCRRISLRYRLRVWRRGEADGDRCRGAKRDGGYGDLGLCPASRISV